MLFDDELRLSYVNEERKLTENSCTYRFKHMIWERITNREEPPMREEDPNCIRRPWSFFGCFIQKPERKWVWYRDHVPIEQYDVDELLDILEQIAFM